METLVSHSDASANEILSFTLESQFGGSVTVVDNPATLLEKPDDLKIYNLIILESDAKAKIFLEALEKTNLGPMVIFIKPINAQLDVSATCKYSKLIGTLSLDEVPEKLLALIREMVIVNTAAEDPREYCKIQAELMTKIGPLTGDIFIRLSDDKFVKLYKTGTSLTEEEFNKLLKTKKVRSLFIRKADSLGFISKLKENLITMIMAADPMVPEELLNHVTWVQETVYELTRRIGFTPEVTALARENVNLTIKAIGQTPQISKALHRSNMKDQNYVSSHSTLLAHIACSVASAVKMGSDTTFQKLVLAALFHDFTFEDSELAKLSDEKTLEELKQTLGKPELEKVLAHPLRAVESLRKIREMPGDVDFLVYQHHEKPDGKGFPKGLFAHQIVALSAVFIVSHEILDEFLKDQKAFSMKAFLEVKKNYYSAGAFKNIWKELAEAEEDRNPLKLAS